VMNNCRSGADERPRASLRLTDGFTLVELIIVLIIIGIVAATAMVGWPGKSINIVAQTDLIVQDIRFTQSRAMAQAKSGERWRITFTGSSYTIADKNGTTIKSVSLDSGLSFTGNGFTGGYLAFDGMGAPYNGATLMTATVSIVLSGGGLTQTISVSKNTGAVQTS
jgi:prepilin-type N-terminal cleavage/methylation domain-containing protein